MGGHPRFMEYTDDHPTLLPASLTALDKDGAIHCEHDKLAWKEIITMPKTKTICVAIIGVLMLSAMASASASAATAGWMVGGTNLATGTSEAISEATKKVSATYKLEFGGTGFECEVLKVEGGFITGPSKNGAKSLHFSGCNTKTANCKLSNSTLSTLPVLSEATLDPPNALAAVIVFKPETAGGPILTFKFEGEKCAIAGTKAIAGTQAMLAPTGADENTEQVLTAIELVAGELKAGSANAKLTGSAGLTLASKKTWSFL
jgi:hypothetical protein